METCQHAFHTERIQPETCILFRFGTVETGSRGFSRNVNQNNFSEPRPRKKAYVLLLFLIRSYCFYR